MGKLRRELATRRGRARRARRRSRRPARTPPRADERDELARHIDDADAVAATLRRQVADRGTERDAHELDAKKFGRRVRELEREAEAAVDLKRQLVSLKTDRDDLQTMSDARSAALHRRVRRWKRNSQKPATAPAPAGRGRGRRGRGARGPPGARRRRERVPAPVAASRRA